MNYPAFDWVNKYNETYGSQLGAARPAWYMPSIAELCELYKNKDAVNASLSKINELDGTYTDGSLEEDVWHHSVWYWSSSQHSVYDFNAWIVGFSHGYSGYLRDADKRDDYHVCCIAGF